MFLDVANRSWSKNVQILKFKLLMQQVQEEVIHQQVAIPLPPCQQLDKFGLSSLMSTNDAFTQILHVTKEMNNLHMNIYNKKYFL